MCVGSIFASRRVGVASPRGSSGRWSFLAPVSAVAGSPHHGWQEGPQPARLGTSWRWEQPASAGECAVALWFPKMSFGLLCFPPLPLQQTASVCSCRHRSAAQADAKPETCGSSVERKCLSLYVIPLFEKKNIYPCISLYAKMVIMSGPCTECLCKHMGAPKPAPRAGTSLRATAQKQPLRAGSNETAEWGYCSSCCCLGRSAELRKQGQIKCVWRNLAGLLWL